METPVASRNPSPTDVSDEEWAVVAPDLSLMTPAAAAQQHGLALEVGKLAAAQRGFVVLPRRWVVERSFAWAARCRRLATDDERLPEPVAGRHCVALACLMLHRLVTVVAQSP